MINSKIEDFRTDKKFDFIYCSHTLEHVNSARLVLEIIYTLLSTEGLAYIEVPNIRMIDTDQPSEFFIDNHLYHFDSMSLMRMLTGASLKVVCMECTDTIIRLVCRQEDSFSSSKKSSKEEKGFDYSFKIRDYSERLRTWRQSADGISKILRSAKINGRNVVAWGAARTTHYLVENSDFSYSDFDLIVDLYLSVKPKEILEELPFSVYAPSELNSYKDKPVTLFIGSVEFIDEIKEQAKKLIDDIEFVTIFSAKEVGS